jgi:hypothetical protein
MEHHFEPVRGMFDDARVFTKYLVRARFTELVVGGIPQKPEVIESWLRQRILGGDQELAIMLRKTLHDLEIDVAEDATREEIIEAATKMAATRNGNTFRRNGCGLALAAYNVKAMLKEATAILYPGGNGGHAWGKTRKAPRSFLAERVFVDEYQVPLGRDEPDGTLMQVGHPDTPQGKRSTLTYYDYCVQPEVTFTISSSEDAIAPEQWERILVQGQRLGMGALRSLNYGQFRVMEFAQA